MIIWSQWIIIIIWFSSGWWLGWCSDPSIRRVREKGEETTEREGEETAGREEEETAGREGEETAGRKGT